MMVGADKIIGVDTNPAREAMGRRFGITRFINPKDVPNAVDAIVQLTLSAHQYGSQAR